MKGLKAYQQQTGTGWTRIDLLLALYDGAIDQIELAASALAQKDSQAAKPLLHRAGLLVSGMVAGTNPEGGDISFNLLRLYEHVLHGLQTGRPDNLKSALDVLRTLREGFLGIRADAQQLERSGSIPPADSVVLRECSA